MNNTEQSNNNNNEPNKTEILLRSIQLITISCAIVFLLVTSKIANPSNANITIRFDNLNSNNKKVLTESSRKPNELYWGNDLAAKITNEGIELTEVFLKDLNLIGYSGPITNVDKMITFNDGDPYYSDRYNITLADDVPVEFIHNYANDNFMDVINQENKTFTVVFRREKSLAEYKATMEEINSFNEVVAIEKIFLTTEDSE